MIANATFHIILTTASDANKPLFNLTENENEYILLSLYCIVYFTVNRIYLYLPW